MGLAGALPGFLTPMPTAPWAYRNPRALAGAALSSGALCSFFWWFSNGARELEDGSRDLPGSTPPQNPALVMPPPQGGGGEYAAWTPSEIHEQSQQPSRSEGGKEQLVDPWASASN